jgi:hypothetical protein
MPEQHDVRESFQITSGRLVLTALSLSVWVLVIYLVLWGVGYIQ